MSLHQRFLLVGGTSDHAWHQVLKEALTPLGELQSTNEKEAITLILQNEYKLVIVDSLAVISVPLFVSRIRAQQPATRVVVATASPTWRRAREIFHAGATDYIHKTYDREELLCTLLTTMNKTPPPWPR